MTGTGEPWEVDALCAQADPETFFPDKGGNPRPAKAVCRDCTVRAECLDYAITHREPFGIWGGLSVRERRALSIPLPRTCKNEDCGAPLNSNAKKQQRFCGPCAATRRRLHRPTRKDSAA